MAETPPDRGNGTARYTVDDVNEIVTRRAIIEQAKGVLMYLFDVAADEAFNMLRSQSRVSRVTVHRLAQLILDDPRLADDLWA